MSKLRLMLVELHLQLLKELTKKYKLVKMPENLKRNLPCSHFFLKCNKTPLLKSLLQQQTHLKVMTGNGQLTRGAFIINDFKKSTF